MFCPISQLLNVQCKVLQSSYLACKDLVAATVNLKLSTGRADRAGCDSKNVPGGKNLSQSVQVDAGSRRH